MLQSKSRAWIEINLQKLAHNVEEIRKLIPASSKIMAIVKADAYGHGDVVCCKALQKVGVDFFGVSSVDEALNLRNAGIKDQILILGYTPREHFHYLTEYDLIQTFLSLEYAKKLNEFATLHHQQIRGHLKLDTGMSRLGVIVQEQNYQIDEVLEIYRLTNLKVEGVFSHFAVSDGLDEDNVNYTKKQIACFDKVIADIKKHGYDVGVTHLQNSYGILNYRELQYDYVRPGLLYMGVTSDDAIEINSNPDFKAILELKANVSLVKTIKKDVNVSYGRHFKSNKVTKLATISIGYADGYPRLLSNQNARVLIHGKYAKIVGNICMDQCMIDVSDIEDVKEGDIVTLIGEQDGKTITVDEISRLAHTINNETFTRLTARLPRFYLE